jgi:hypothetical protein
MRSHFLVSVMGGLLQGNRGSYSVRSLRVTYRANGNFVMLGCVILVVVRRGYWGGGEFIPSGFRQLANVGKEWTVVPRKTLHVVILVLNRGATPSLRI